MGTRTVPRSGHSGNAASHGNKKRGGRERSTEMQEHRHRLLVVDDNEDNRYTLSLLLEIEGYTDLTMAEDGAQALETLRTQKFDLVLLDVMMPRMDGYQVLEALRAENRLGDPPVIMISALEELASTVRCIELGAVDYLPKPFEPVLLKARVRATLEQKALADEVKRHRDRMEAELNEARELQRGLCPLVFPPSTPARPFDVFGSMIPAHEVSGDFFDFFFRVDDKLCAVIGDVAGKGAPAALFMARARDIIRLAAERIPGQAGGPMEPHEIVGLANVRLAAANLSCTFVTLFVVLLDPASGALRYCNAGHCDPYLLGRDGGLRAVTGAKGPPVGIRPRHSYSSDTGTLAPGETLFLYTDGVTEALDPAGALFGESRLEAMLQSREATDARGIATAVTSEVTGFAAGAEQADDITVLAVRMP
jgi:sigma-B regulation protein RsbU (phosphoserine phosphatase)